MTARTQALAAGLKTYVTGTPCKQGHLAPRATRTGTCTECTKAATQNWLDRHPAKGAEYAASYRAKHRVQVQTKDRAKKKELRETNPEYVRKINKKAYATRVRKTQNRDVRVQNRTPESELVLRIQQAHAGRLQYVFGFASMTANATFLCLVHGELSEAHPHNVLRGASPCPKCNHMKSSQEDAIAKFLAIFTPVVQRDRAIIKPRELDIYLPQQQLAVEYCGMFWHSHGDQESERKNKLRHFKKHEDCATAGVRLITVYESEWQANSRAIKRLLRNAIGKSKGRLGARKCALRKVPVADARAFYDKYHPQGGAGHGEHYGLYWRDKLVACMRFVYGANDRGLGAANRVWTLGRYATRVNIAGGASRLFKAFLAEHKPTTVKSFSDSRYFAGGMYQQLGFRVEQEGAPDYQVWSPKIGLRPKSHYQRRNLPARLKEHGLDPAQFDPATDSRTEADITYLMGARRIYDCGKIRWVWTVDTSTTT